MSIVGNAYVMTEDGVEPIVLGVHVDVYYANESNAGMHRFVSNTFESRLDEDDDDDPWDEIVVRPAD